MSPLPINPAMSPTVSMASHFARAISYVLTTRDEDEDAKCHPRPDIDLCEKPQASNHTMAILIGVLGGLLVVSTVGTLFVLHIRRQRQEAQEFPKSNQELDDYGVGPMPPAPAAKPPRPIRPENAYRQPHAEPDDGDDLKPPGRRDSLNSLARSIRGNPDAYRSRADDISHDMKPVEPASQL
ncbi:hypothetical protein F4813DRAFT_345950 [Daldinia decipiens]|uniref:uncharacterized protein n=1 Tax=Daldinia decipiens TaxID=326647 RepID=UPI0020C2E0BF|nr:uncharacterized protein F4813DRAFT_345950 [Daldinia decipiens]KAI1661841.1 hypothetical protein F4813DRAFT_345950 [Daldinia decipiens]